MYLHWAYSLKVSEGFFFSASDGLTYGTEILEYLEPHLPVLLPIFITTLDDSQVCSDGSSRLHLLSQLISLLCGQPLV